MERTIWLLLMLLMLVSVSGYNGEAEAAQEQAVADSGDARTRTARTQVHQIHEAVEQFVDEKGRQPAGLVELVIQPTEDGGKYVERPMLADPWGRLYQFRSPGTHGPFDIFSYGPQGENDNKDGYIGNWQ